MADASSRIDIEGRSLRLTNAAKVLYPATGTTKADVLDYYLAVAERLVGQAWMRPATRKRWPNGVGTEQEPGESFFTKQLERGAPGWVATGTIEHQHRTVTYPLVNDRPTVAWLAQVATLEIHVPQWRFDDAGGHLPPDRLVLDLDPGPGAGLPECVEVAFTAKDLLEDMGLQVVPVTSGSKGLHLYAGLDGTQPTDQVNAFAREFARALEGLLPTLVVWEMKKSLRVGKVLVDWSQNNGNKTTVCPWSLRGRTRPMVAAPRSWDELADPGVAHLAMGEVLARLADGWEDPMAALAHAPDPPATEARTGPQTSGASDRLSAYRRMRDPGRTPEPVPTGVSGRPEQAAPSFVIQEHHARRLHWDFRLERNGVLVSWALPKGPPTDPARNNLAVHVEDHPLEYGSFEGEIPKGEYGAGQVTIWDSGTIEVEKWREGKEVIVTLHGRPDGGLGGRPARFALIATRAGGQEKNWLIHRMKPAPTRTSGPALPRPEQAAPEQATAAAGSTAITGPDVVLPMLASPGTPGSMDSEDWVFEMKWDGIRAIAEVRDGAVRLTSRTGRDITAEYPELSELASCLGGDGRVDGEIVALDEAGRPSFSLLQQRMHLTRPAEVAAARARVPVHYLVFDVLGREQASLLTTRYEQRRAVLEEFVQAGRHVHVPPLFDVSVHEALEISAELGLEGIIGKRRTSVYRPGTRSRTWLKVKHRASQEVLVVGWRPGLNGRGIGSLLIGVHDDGGTLAYAGRVGSGLTGQQLDLIAGRLDGLGRIAPTAEGVPPDVLADARWVEPVLVGEVTFSERTPAGILRHPVWLGLRDDKDPATVFWE